MCILRCTVTQRDDFVLVQFHILHRYYTLTRLCNVHKLFSTHKINALTSEAWSIDKIDNNGYKDHLDAKTETSHLCHNRNCTNINHICWESRPLNMARLKCTRMARRAETNEEQVPHECKLHDPPCKLREYLAYRDQSALQRKQEEWFREHFANQPVQFQTNQKEAKVST